MNGVADEGFCPRAQASLIDLDALRFNHCANHRGASPGLIAKQFSSILKLVATLLNLILSLVAKPVCAILSHFPSHLPGIDAGDEVVGRQMVNPQMISPEIVSPCRRTIRQHPRDDDGLPGMRCHPAERGAGAVCSPTESRECSVAIFTVERKP